MSISNLIKKPKTKLGAESLRTGLTDSSPMLIIICFIFSLICLGVVKYNYQVALFNVINSSISFWVSMLFAIVVQVGRMAFGFVGVRDLVRGKWVIGIGGICASIAITVFEHTEVNRMVHFWGNEDLKAPLLFLVWIALVFELRLIMTMSGSNESDKEYQKELQAAEAAEKKRLEDLTRQIENQYRLKYEIKGKEEELIRKQQYMKDREAAILREEKERKERYYRELEAMKKRRLNEEKERAARFKKEEAERQARRSQEEKERQARLAKKDAKRKRKAAKKAETSVSVGKEQMNGQQA